MGDVDGEGPDEARELWIARKDGDDGEVVGGGRYGQVAVEAPLRDGEEGGRCGGEGELVALGEEGADAVSELSGDCSEEHCGRWLGERCDSC